MDCDIIIPTWKGETQLPRLLAGLARQRLQPRRIIVIDSSSPDRTVAIAREASCHVEVISKNEFNHGGTRNRAANLAEADILVFMTQDATPVDENFLLHLCAPFADELVGGAYARQLPYPDADPPEAYARNFNYPAEPQVRDVNCVAQLGVKAYFFSNVASAIRRTDFLRLGGFPERVPMNEDMVFCAQLLQSGRKVVYAANAHVLHSHRYTIVQQFRRYFDIGAFFAEQGHLLPGGRVGGEGMRFAWGQLCRLLAQGHWGWALRAPWESGAKWLAFRLGCRHSLIPRWLKLRMSMHAFYW